MRDKPTKKIGGIVEPLEGILLFDENFHPLFCNKMIKPLCRQVCRSGPCVLEKGEEQAPELFKIIRTFRTDCGRLFRDRRANPKSGLIPHSIIYVSPDGDFTIRCMQLRSDMTGLRGSLWQMTFFKGVAFNSLDFDIVDRKYGLTAAELKVLKVAMGGLSTTEIAEKLLVSKVTVKTHLRHIFEKLGITRRSQILSKLI
jgi:DNA-binding CsgD family transcriptional regulator